VEVVPICEAAGLTTGALYHHFGNRNGLLRAVVEAVAESVATKAAKAMEGIDDDWEQLRAGVHCVLDCCLEDEVRVTYNEAPSIVGLDEWRRIEESKTGVLLVTTLLRLQQDGLLKPLSIELLAAMVKGAIVEGAMTITRSSKPKRTRAEAGELLDALLESVRRRS
ncbi:MAG: TetR/AcrR family transcriptional regulator, partial [Archangiaceae bacterium]|nr:TetR/AcrR family transcriptional regulator [Archangiaceae bacterium]